MIEFRVLGSLDLRGPEGEEVLSVLSQPKRVALLAYLAVATPRGFHRRDKLVGLFWPELDQDRARAALRKSLHHLRQSLGDNAVLSRGDEEVSLNWDLLRCDAAEFDDAVEECPVRALELYRGDLLGGGFFLSGCPEFDRWLDDEREGLRVAAARAGWEVAHRHLAAGRINDGEQAAQRALALVPTDESEVRRFIEALAGAGDRACAVRFYERFAGGLRDELELEPSAETKAVLEGIRAETRGSAPARPDIAPSPEERTTTAEPASPRPPAAGPTLAERIRGRKIVQWGIAYLAGAWALVEATGFGAEQFHWPDVVPQGVTLVAVFGFFVVLVLAWYHGEKGRQRVSGPELLMLATLLVIAGGVLTTLREPSNGSRVAAIRGDDDRPGVAVLPCENWSTDPADEFLAAQIHEEILLKLQSISALFSIGRTSVRQYAEDPPPTPQIASELTVGFIGECSVTKHGNQARVVFQLLDGRNGGQLWAGDFDQVLNPTNLYDVIRQIAQEIVLALRVEITPAEADRISAVPTENAQALALYLRGREYWAGDTEAELQAGVQVLTQAIALDSSFASAHAWLSRTHGRLFDGGFDRTPQRSVQQRAAAERALALNTDMPEGHVAMGFWLWNNDRREEAAEHFLAAHEKTPNDPVLLEWIGFVYRDRGAWAEAMAAFETAARLDPRETRPLRRIGGLYGFFHRYPEAIQAYDRILDLAPNDLGIAYTRARQYFFWQGQLDTLRAVVPLLPESNLRARLGLAHWMRDAEGILALLNGLDDDVVVSNANHFHPRTLWAGWAHRLRGDQESARTAFDSARAFLEPLLQQRPDDSRLLDALGYAYAGLGRSEEADSLAHRYLRTGIGAMGRPRAAERCAVVLAQAGLADRAIPFLEPLLSGPSFTSVHQLRVDPRYDPIRTDPRFHALIQRHTATEER
jgi:DNA-binding SARP family transcriptional activator/TolB-like protein